MSSGKPVPGRSPRTWDVSRLWVSSFMAELPLPVLTQFRFRQEATSARPPAGRAIRAAWGGTSGGRGGTSGGTAGLPWRRGWDWLRGRGGAKGRGGAVAMGTEHPRGGADALPWERRGPRGGAEALPWERSPRGAWPRRCHGNGGAVQHPMGGAERLP